MTAGLYKLYGRASAGSLAVQIALEEIGAPYEMIWVGKAPMQLQILRQVNPTGKVPALLLPDGTAVFESAAILIHLTLAHPEAKLAPLPGSAAHARFLQWMLFMSSGIYEAALRAYYPERYSEAGAAAAAPIKSQATADYARQLELIHGSLAPYVLGKEYSIADAYLLMLASWYTGDVAALNARLPKLALHAQLLRDRPAVRKSEQAHAKS